MGHPGSREECLLELLLKLFRFILSFSLFVSLRKKKNSAIHTEVCVMVHKCSKMVDKNYKVKNL